MASGYTIFDLIDAFCGLSKKYLMHESNCEYQSWRKKSIVLQNDTIVYGSSEILIFS